MLKSRFSLQVVTALLCLMIASAISANDRRVEGFPPSTKSTGVKPGTTMTEAEPIFAGGGEFRESWPLISLGGPIPVEFNLHYAPDLMYRSPINDGAVPFPPGHAAGGFASSSMIRIVEMEDRDQQGNPAYANIFLSDDTAVLKEVTPGVFTSLEPEGYELKKVGEKYFFMDPVRNRVLVFRSRYLGWDLSYPGQPSIFIRTCGEVEWIFDRNGNSLHFFYNEDNNPVRMDDGLGRALEFSYLTGEPGARHLSSISDGRGRTVQFAYREAPCGSGTALVLDSFTDPAGSRTSFEYADPGTSYNCNRVTRIIRPLGNCTVDQTWGWNPAVQVAIKSQRDAFGNETKLDMPFPSGSDQSCQFTFYDGTTRSFLHRDRRYPLTYSDEAGAKTTYEYDSSNRLIGRSDQLGHRASFTFHQCGKTATATDPEGRVTTMTYESGEQTFTHPGSNDTATFVFYDLARRVFPDGSFEAFGRDARGNPTTVTEAGGNAWTFTYDGRGNLLASTNPDGGRLVFTYNPDGTLLSRTEEGAGTTAYGYDPFGRVNRVTHPDGTGLISACDAMGRITGLTDEMGAVFTFEYDANGNLLKVTAPGGESFLYTYDAMNRLISVTDPSGAATSLTLNPFGAITSLTGATGLLSTFEYDARRRLIRETVGGSTLGLVYDDAGLMTGSTGPAGDLRTFEYDASDQPLKLTGALGQTTTYSYDGGGNLEEIADPMCAVTEFTWDARGLLSGVAAPGGTSATIQRNPSGLISQVEDPLGNSWSWERSPLGLVTSFSDPLGRKTEFTFDARNLPDRTFYPDGTSLERTRDEAGRVTGLSNSAGPELSFAFDASGRLAQADGVRFAYDTAKRSLLARYGQVELSAEYDASGRLTKLAHPWSMTVTYTYDDTNGLLRRVSDSLSGAWVELGYGPDLRPVTWTRSNGVKGTWVWDLSGRLTGVEEGDFLDLTYTYDPAGNVLTASGKMPVDPGEGMQGEQASWSHDAACQIAGAGSSYDARGRQVTARGHEFSWDGASRMAACDGATLEYDGLGYMTSRRRGEETTEYFPHPALPGGRIVAERQNGGLWTYNIWLPTGELAYRVERVASESGPSVSFYHFDRNGHTLALTDASGSVTDRYAYDPYGKMLAHSGPSAQPFTFQGMWGSFQEGGSGEIFHVGARIYHTGLGRFLTPDPSGPSVEKPATLNPYQFAFQNPTSYFDESGFMPRQFSAFELRLLGFQGPDIDLLEKMELCAEAVAAVHNTERKVAWELSDLLQPDTPQEMFDLLKKRGLLHRMKNLKGRFTMSQEEFRALQRRIDKRLEELERQGDDMQPHIMIYGNSPLFWWNQHGEEIRRQIAARHPKVPLEVESRSMPYPWQHRKTTYADVVEMLSEKRHLFTADEFDRELNTVREVASLPRDPYWGIWQ